MKMKQMTLFETSGGQAAIESNSRLAPTGNRAFSLIELLTVIAIIGLLAAITMGVTGLASRKMKESRMKAELHLLMSKIEDYKSKLAVYPPDNPRSSVTNQLFYELSGAIFDRGIFRTLNGQEEVRVQSVPAIFNRDGIANSARERGDVRYTTDFKPNQYKEIVSGNLDIEVLIAPIKGPIQYGPRNDLNPWNYISSNPINNPNGGYDLWADVLIGNQVYRFCNWSSEPILLPEPYQPIVIK